HLAGIVGYAGADRRWDVVGGGRRWFAAGITELVVAVMCVGVGVGVGALVSRWSAGRHARIAKVSSLVAALLLASVTVLWGPAWASNADEESTFDQFAFDLRLLRHAESASGEVSVIEKQMAEPLRALRERLGRRSPASCAVVGTPSGSLPSVIVIVVESFRS